MRILFPRGIGPDGKIPPEESPWAIFVGMKNNNLKNVGLSIVCLLALLMPMPTSTQAQSGPPPVAAPLVREGDLAIRLGSGLGISTADDEIEAENQLADVGISPRNGWIADYPATPDIIGELQQAVGAAVDAGKVPLGRDEALKRLNDTLGSSNLSMIPYPQTGSAEAPPPRTENYPNPAVVNDYYYNEGPPIVTYYTPPPDFYYLYAWVPSPFWWSGFWFPGFFVLHDFHRTMVVSGRPAFISNHFRDITVNRVFRIDPAARFQGRTFGGIGAARSSGLLSTGVPGSDRRIFNSPAPRISPGGSMGSSPSHGGVSRGGGHGR